MIAVWKVILNKESHIQLEDIQLLEHTQLEDIQQLKHIQLVVHMAATLLLMEMEVILALDT